MNLLFSPESLRSLDAIWLWNADQHGPDHADRYLAFLLSETRRLIISPLVGSAVPTRPALRYLLLRKRKRGHGHVAVYQVAGQTVRILDYFHTAQDWQRKVTE